MDNTWRFRVTFTLYKDAGAVLWFDVEKPDVLEAQAHIEGFMEGFSKLPGVSNVLITNIGLLGEEENDD